MDRRRLARPRPRRQLFPQAVAAGLAARRIQAAARGFLARRRLQRQRRGLMSPADVRAIKRRQGQVKAGRPGVFPKYRIGSLVGTDKSKRTVNPMKVDPRVVKIHYDYNHQVTQTQVAYFGFMDGGSMKQQLDHGCLALAQMIYRRIGIIAVHEDMNVETRSTTHTYTPKIDQIRMHFDAVNEDGTTSDFNTVITDGLSTGTITLATLRDAIVDAVLNQANSGAWPTNLDLVSGTDMYQRYDLTNVMIHFNAMQKYKYQNITPSTGLSEGQGSTVNDVSANPLSGRIYQFKHVTPRLKSIVKENDHTSFPLDNLAKIEDITSNSEQGNLACEAFRTGTVYNGTLKLGFRQPFKAVSVFDNTSHEDKFYMPPGGYKQMIKKTSVVMNFKRFCIATAIRGPGLNPAPYIGLNNDERVKRIGTSTLWAVEPAVRTSQNEVTKLIVNRELWLTAKALPGKTRQAVRAKTFVEDGADFGA